MHQWSNHHCSWRLASSVEAQGDAYTTHPSDMNDHELCCHSLRPVQRPGPAGGGGGKEKWKQKRYLHTICQRMGGNRRTGEREISLPQALQTDPVAPCAPAVWTSYFWQAIHWTRLTLIHLTCFIFFMFYQVSSCIVPCFFIIIF